LFIGNAHITAIRNDGIVARLNAAIVKD